MAERRMFAKTIIDSDAFLDMPVTARLLYYDLSMRADDDGFVNSPKKIMRMIGASQDDLSILILRKFILPFDNGIVVIKHWRIHNYIRKDTYNPTPYTDEMNMLTVDDNKAYSFKDDTSRPRLVDGSSTQDNKGNKDNKDNYNTYTSSEFDEFWSEYPRKVGKKDARKAFDKALKTTDAETMIRAVIAQKQSGQWLRENGRYIPNPATWLNQGRWDDEIQPVTTPSMKLKTAPSEQHIYDKDELRRRAKE